MNSNSNYVPNTQAFDGHFHNPNKILYKQAFGKSAYVWKLKAYYQMLDYYIPYRHACYYN